MTRQRSRRYHGQSSLVTALPVLMLLDFGIGTASAQQAAKPEGNPASEIPAGQEFAIAWPARGARHQIFGLAQGLLQDSRSEHGLPDIDQRYV